MAFATTIGYTLAGLIAAGIIFIGARFLVAPRVVAAGYGVQPDLSQQSTGAYLSVKAVRDIASGCLCSFSWPRVPRTCSAG